MMIPATEGPDQLLLTDYLERRYIAGLHVLSPEQAYQAVARIIISQERMNTSAFLPRRISLM